jgi:L-fuconolactonase
MEGNSMIDVIDSHVHFWEPSHLNYPWLGDIEKINRPYLPGDLPRQGTGWSMSGLVFVQADCVPEQGIEEARWVASLADDRIQGIVAFAPLEKGDAARAELDQLKDIPLVKGVRRLIQSEPLGFCVQPDFVQGVRSLADYGLSFDLCIYHPQLPDVIRLVEQCPQIEFVLDHVGKPGIKDGLQDPWREQIVQLAAFPNVRCKISGMVTEADHDNWQPADLEPYIAHIIEAFGIERLMFGGDYPVVELAATYPQWMETVIAATGAFSDEEKRQFFVDNARAFYELP